MSFSTFSGPVRVGTNRYNPGRNTGLVTLAQSYDSGTVSAATGNVDVTAFVIPQGSQIYDIVVDQVQIPTATSTFTISVGTTSGGAELVLSDYILNELRRVLPRLLAGVSGARPLLLRSWHGRPPRRRIRRSLSAMSSVLWQPRRVGSS